MSIPNFIHKIKSKTGLDKVTLLYLVVVVLVGVSSFGLGRISTEGNKTDSKDIVIEDNTKIDKDNGTNLNLEADLSTEKRYVASKNGKMYYSLGCSGSKRIKPENEVWFKTREDAEKSGFVFSSTCK